MFQKKCNGCGKTVHTLGWPKGWVKIGTSRYGKRYDRDGIAWWCSSCHKAKKHGC